MKQKRTIIAIDAQGVADFRRQLDQAIAAAQRVAGIPVLPEAGSASETAPPWRTSGPCSSSYL